MKFFSSWKQNLICKQFPAEGLQYFLQLEALYLMFATSLKRSDSFYILYWKMKRNKRFKESGAVDYKFYFKKILANQFKISCEKLPLKISWLQRYRTFSSPGCCVAWLHRKTRVDRVHTVWKVREKSIKFWVGQGELENVREFFLKSYMMRENQGNILNISCGDFSEALFLQA